MANSAHFVDLKPNINQSISDLRRTCRLTNKTAKKEMFHLEVGDMGYEVLSQYFVITIKVKIRNISKICFS